MNEAEIRAADVDHALEAAGAGIVEGSRIRREHLTSKAMGRSATVAPRFVSFTGQL